ncbi:hypothetical protein [Phyllobacterium phragmitis]|nr:hypothetical protein [Phyllobacterium phragmitis]
MSVYVAIKYTDCVRLMTDGASWDVDGNLAKVESKVFRAKSLPLAITGRGHDAITKKLAGTGVKIADKSGSVEIAIEGLAAIFRTMKEQNTADLDAKDTHFDLLVAGYTPPRGFFILVAGTNPDDPTPYCFREQSFAAGGPRLGPELAHTFSKGIPQSDKRFLELRGVELMEAFRLAGVPDTTTWGTKVPMLGASAGGVCELTTITRDGAATELLKDYGDPIGEPINPYRHTQNVEYLGNRKEHRISKARKRVA